MEMNTASGQEHAGAYMFQGNGLTGFTGEYAPQDLEHFGAMHKEGAPDLLVEQSMHYPPPANYGYCTGLKSPGDWVDHQMAFGVDGLNVHYAGVGPENYPFLYYAPYVAYAQSPYNPYNPYIPGAVFGVDGSFVGVPPQYYNLPSYENQTSSPMHAESRSDINANNNTSHSFVDTISPNAYKGPSLKNSLSSASPARSVTPWLSAPNRANSSRRTSGRNNAVATNSYQRTSRGNNDVARGNVTSLGLLVQSVSAPNILNRSAQGAENLSHRKTLSGRTQSKLGLSSGNGFSSFRPSTHALGASDKVQRKFTYRKVDKETKMLPDKSREQDQSPKVDISGNKSTVRAFTSRAEYADVHGNITINLDQYDKNDFFIDYSNAKFFVIKSYSEEDVHNSIKYNVWSSTPTGNKRLNSAYDGIHITNDLSESCPIFLFFSVNASGQFCGLAEMIGPVDFHKDMDFWQQDKWIGSFPVKWHILKDVPNFKFRHIVLENNFNKPVTYSRDTQEVPYNKGMEMLKIFKSYFSKTSLDDLLYYENQQRILQEEKTRLILKKYSNSFFVPIQQDQLCYPNSVPEKHNNSSSSSLDKALAAAADADDYDDASASKTVELEANVEDDALKIGSLTIGSSTHSGSTGPLEEEEATTGGGNPGGVVVSDFAWDDVLTVVGSIPVTGFLTVGSVKLYPKALQDMVSGGSVKGVTHEG